jgi:hypothetical protein
MRFLFNFIRALVIRLVIAGALIGIVAGGVVAAKLAGDAQLQQARANTVALYGETAVKRCSAKLSKNAIGEVAADPKLAVIDIDKLTVVENYQAALDKALQPTKPEEVNTVVCVREKVVKFNTDTYSSPTSSTKYTCTQYAHDLEIFVVDVKSGKVIGFNTVEGTPPAECPDKTSTNLTRDGELPPPEDVNAWLSKALS